MSDGPVAITTPLTCLSICRSDVITYLTGMNHIGQVLISLNLIGTAILHTSLHLPLILSGITVRQCRFSFGKAILSLRFQGNFQKWHVVNPNNSFKSDTASRCGLIQELERKENFLRYLITYKIKTGEKNSLGQIELELDKEPTFMDEAILDAAMKDSIKLTESRMIALSIKSIQPINWSLLTTNSTISSEIHMKNYLLPLITIFFFVGCASNSSNVVPSGNETYTVSASRPVVGVGYSTGAQESVYEQANTFCKNKDLNFEVVQFTQNPSSFGRAANATLQFRCMKK
jgi:hypothetical protein